MPAPQDFQDLVNIFIDIISLAIPVVFGLTLLFVIWKLVDAWVISAGDEKKVDEGKKIALVAVIALVFMSAIWGILQLLQYSLFY